MNLLAASIVLVAAFSISVSAQQNLDLAGSYLFLSEWGGTKITLKKNGTFTSQSSSCTGVTTQSGPYTVSNGVVSLTTLKLTERAYEENKERDLTKRDARKKYLHTAEPFAPFSRELQVIKWGARVYLLDAGTLGTLVHAINLGFEPRSVDGYRAFYGVIYLREGDESKPVDGAPPLSIELLANLLPSPVIGTVVEIDGDRAVAKINRGRADRLKEGMLLVPVVSTLHFEGYVIDSVTDHTAEVHFYTGIKLGDQLSTRVPNALVYAP